MSTKRLLSLLVLSLLFSVGCNLLKPRTSSAPPPRPNTDSGVASLRRNVVNYGQKFVGTKYHYAGTSPNTGFDCSGFTSYVMKEFNIKVSPASSKKIRSPGCVRSSGTGRPSVACFDEAGETLMLNSFMT